MKFFPVVFLLVFLLPGQLLANQLTLGEPPSLPDRVRKLVPPKLADIAPLATALPVRFAALENSLKKSLDVASIEREYSAIVADLDEISSQFRQLQQQEGSESKRVVEFASLRRTVKAKKILLKKVSAPLKGEIRRLDGLRLKWLEEQERWTVWQSSLLKERKIARLKLIFAEANNIIDSALLLVRQRLESILTLQFKVATALEKLNILDGDLLSDTRQNNLTSPSPPILSFRYFSQYTGNDDLWVSMWAGLRHVGSPGRYFVTLHVWNFLIQALFFSLIISVIRRNRVDLNESDRWKFLSDRPVSASLFIVVLISILLLSYLPNREALRTLYLVVGGISCTRILGKVVEPLWQRQALYGVMVTFIINEIFLLILLPQPLVRLYIFFVALLALYFFIRWSGKASSQKEASGYLWLLRLGYCSAVVILLAELFGKAELSSYLFGSIILSIAVTFPCLLLMYMVYGGLRWLFFSSPVWQIKLLRSDAESLVRKVGFLFLAAMVWFFILPAFLVAWGVYDGVLEATTSIFSQGFFIGTSWISVGTIFASVAVFYMTLLISHILPKVLLDEVITGHKMQRGVQNSIGKLIRYSIVCVGFLFAFMALGFDFTKLTIIMGALGVGIGFGLQGIVNNFVSGLILLFERPLREGDTIELGEKSARIKKIGLRATVVETFDQADVIIPNADLINNQVTNWTLANRQVRLSVPVGVAYGSDVSLVVETLLACAKRHETVAKTPAPQVLFTNFGESSLDFELRVWIPDADTRLRVKSDLYHDIEQAFRETDIEIPFPQMDLHFRESGGGENVLSTEPELKE